MPSLQLSGPDGREIGGISQFAISAQLNGLGTFEIDALSDATDSALQIFARVQGQLVRTNADSEGVNLNTYRITSQRRNRIAAQIPRVINWQGEPNVSWYLSRTAIGPGNEPGNPDNKVRFADLTVGGILYRMRTLAVGRGALNPAEVTLDFTTTNDSFGNPWDGLVNFRLYSMTDTWPDVLDDLHDQRKCDWWIANDKLRVVNFGSSHDFSIGTDPLVVDTGQAFEAPQTRSGVDAATACIVSGAPGFVYVLDRSDDYDFPYLECTIEAPEVTDLGTLAMIADTEIRRRMGGGPGNGNGISGQQSVKVPLTGSDPVLPGLSFNCGDRVLLKASGEGSSERIASWSLTGTPAQMTGGISMGDRLEGRDLRLTKRIARLSRATKADRQT